PVGWDWLRAGIARARADEKKNGNRSGGSGLKCRGGAQRGKRRRLESRADDQGPEGLELGLRVMDQRQTHVLGLGLEKVLVVAGARLPALEHFVEARLTGADVLGRELGVIAGPLHAIPGV